MITVKCKHCNWTGKEHDLNKVDEIEHCPSCHRTDGLLDNELQNIHNAIMTDVFGFVFD